jgi:hypothetical protein
MNEPSLIPSLVRTGIAADRPPRCTELPGHTDLRLIKSRPLELVESDDAWLIEVAGFLWARARLGGKPCFMRFAKKRLLRRRPEEYEKLWEIACARRREAVETFNRFLEQFYKIQQG